MSRKEDLDEFWGSGTCTVRALASAVGIEPSSRDIEIWKKIERRLGEKVWGRVNSALDKGALTYEDIMAVSGMDPEVSSDDLMRRFVGMVRRAETQLGKVVSGYSLEKRTVSGKEISRLTSDKNSRVLVGGQISTGNGETQGHMMHVRRKKDGRLVVKSDGRAWEGTGLNDDDITDAWVLKKKK